jgi:hypothetical protein
VVCIERERETESTREGDITVCARMHNVPGSHIAPEVSSLTEVHDVPVKQRIPPWLSWAIITKNPINPGAYAQLAKFPLHASLLHRVIMVSVDELLQIIRCELLFTLYAHTHTHAYRKDFTPETATT